MVVVVIASSCYLFSGLGIVIESVFVVGMAAPHGDGSWLGIMVEFWCVAAGDLGPIFRLEIGGGMPKYVPRIMDSPGPGI